MLLGIDIDGVVADFAGAVNAWVRERYDFDPDDYPNDQWDWFKHWPDHKMVWRSVWNMGCRNEGLFLTCEPVPGAVESLRRLMLDGFYVAFVTHRKEEFEDDTADWLEEYGLLTDSSFLICGAKDKSVAGADVYLDDKVETVESLHSDGHRAFLFATTWNTEAHDRLPTVRNWTQFEFLLTAHWDAA